jgi:hypothetical protein
MSKALATKPAFFALGRRWRRRRLRAGPVAAPELHYFVHFALSLDALDGVIGLALPGLANNYINPTSIDSTASNADNQATLDAALGAGTTIFSGAWTAATGITIELIGSYFGNSLPVVWLSNSLEDVGSNPITLVVTNGLI